MSIADNTTGEIICEQRPTYGGNNPANVHDKYRPGTSRELDRFEETGYIAVPPCESTAELFPWLLLGFPCPRSIDLCPLLRRELCQYLT